MGCIVVFWPSEESSTAPSSLNEIYLMSSIFFPAFTFPLGLGGVVWEVTVEQIS